MNPLNLIRVQPATSKNKLNFINKLLVLVCLINILLPWGIRPEVRPVFAQDNIPELGDPPKYLDAGPLENPDEGTQLGAAVCSSANCVFLPVLQKQITLPGLDRQTSLSLYQSLYQPGSAFSSGWNGSVSSCQSGTTSTAFKNSVINQINYFRQAAGVPPIVALNATYTTKAQGAALMMSSEGDLSHYPDTNWGCYTTNGAEAARNSNLALGMYGPAAIAGYMRDFGANNTAAGHRRWILYPQTQQMGTGDIPSSAVDWAANALWVFDTHMSDPRPATRTEFVAWPPAGYIPYQVVYARWSFSYDNANFSSATVMMNQDGTNIPVTRYSTQNGYGENTLVWIINGMSDSAVWSKPAQDTTYTVRINGVVINSESHNFSYTVTIFDPAP